MLTGRQRQVLARIEGSTLTAVGDELGLTRARVGQITQRLETLGVLTRDVWGWHVTDTGQTELEVKR